MSQWRYSIVVRGREVELQEGESTLGRSRGATISIIDPSISRVHVRFQARGGRVTVEDLGSANGTYINGIRLDRLAEVTDGTRLTVGESDVILKIAKAASPAATVRFDLRDFLCPRCGKPFPEGRKVCPECAAEAAAEAVAEAVLGGDPAPGGAVVMGGPGPDLADADLGTSPELLPPLELDPTPVPRIPAPPPPVAGAAPASPTAPKRRGFWARLFGGR